jgi:hypothetical protein
MAGDWYNRATLLKLFLDVLQGLAAHEPINITLTNQFVSFLVHG